ncbi:MAG: CBS domain-containing protein [Candidatus Hecatellaceae archaeon]
MKRVAEIPVSKLLSEPLTVQPSDLLTKVIGLMKKENVYEVLAGLNGKFGILTTRSILSRSFTPGMKVKSLLEHVPVLTLEDPVGKAAGIMSQYRVRSLPVVSKGKLEGVITTKSIIRRMAEVGVPKLKAKHVMTRDVISIGWGESLAKARKLMVSKRIDHLPVLRRGRPAGIFLSTHIVFSLYPTEAETVGEWVGEAERKLKAPVGEFADENFLACRLDEPAQNVMRRMLEHETTYMLVEFLDEIHGIITCRNLVALLPEPVEIEVPLYITGLPEDPFEAEAARIKFTRAVNLLVKSFPNIMEARSTIKTSGPKGEGRQRYEVDVRIITPKRSYTYRDSGWDLAQIYDNITARLKRIPEEKKRRRSGKHSLEAEGKVFQFRWGEG